jgi:hypothetical protein
MKCRLIFHEGASPSVIDHAAKMTGRWRVVSEHPEEVRSASAPSFKIHNDFTGVSTSFCLISHRIQHL